MYKLSKRSLSRLKGVEPLLIAIVVDSIKESPFDFGIPKDGGFRTPAEQNKLFKKGMSRCDGYVKKSYHQTGLAFDIYINDNGNKDKLEQVAKHIQGIAKERYNIILIWGGDWNNNGIRVDLDPTEHFIDVYHFQTTRNELIK